MNRRLVPLLMAASVAGTIAGCASGPTPSASSDTLRPAITSATPTVPATLTASPPGSPTPTSTPSHTYSYREVVLGFVAGSGGSGYAAANTASFKETAVQLGIEFRFYDGKGLLTNQLAGLAAFTADPRVNVIVLNPLGRSGYDDALRAASAAGKVIIVEGSPIDADPSLYTTYVGSDLRAEGRRAESALCGLLGQSATRHVLELVDGTNADRAAQLSQGFREGLATRLDNLGAACEMDVAISRSASDGASAKAVTLRLLEEKATIDAVFAQTDEQAVGVIEALKQAGRRPGKDVQIVSVGADANAFRAMIAGELGASIECNPLLGPQAYEAALRALNGDPKLPKWIPAQEGEFFAAQGADALNRLYPWGHSKY